MSGSPARIELTGLCKSYRLGRERLPVLDGLDLRVEAGEFVSLLGPSGCGKSTLLRVVAGLELADAGRCLVGGEPVRGPQTGLGIVFQDPMLLDWRDALGNVLLQAEARNLDRAEACRRALGLLARLGLEGFERARPHELSGGMQQRVAICRALLHDPATVLLDEPFGALDALTRDQLGIDLSRVWAAEGKTALLVTHSIEEAVFLSDRVVVLTPRPARAALELAVDLPRPRRLKVRETAAYAERVAALRRRMHDFGVLRDGD